MCLHPRDHVHAHVSLPRCHGVPHLFLTVPLSQVVYPFLRVIPEASTAAIMPLWHHEMRGSARMPPCFSTHCWGPPACGCCA